MVITITISEGDLMFSERMEELEDKIRDLLEKEGFVGFEIEDGYTGNITREKGYAGTQYCKECVFLHGRCGACRECCELDEFDGQYTEGCGRRRKKNE